MKRTARKTFRLVPIGVIHSPFKRIEEFPFQGSRVGVTGEIDLKKQFLPALKDLDGVSHLYLLNFMQGVDRKRPKTVTPHGPEIRETFATRSPHRPNPIGLTVVELLTIDGRRLRVRGVDCLDGTPVIGIKPYHPHIDAFHQAMVGRYEKIRKKGKRKID